MLGLFSLEAVCVLADCTAIRMAACRGWHCTRSRLSVFVLTDMLAGDCQCLICQFILLRHALLSFLSPGHLLLGHWAVHHVMLLHGPTSPQFRTLTLLLLLLLGDD